jgi:CheY-like chemotaxis protein
MPSAHLLVMSCVDVLSNSTHSHEFGMSAHLVKPVTRKSLRDALTKAISSRGSFECSMTTDIGRVRANTLPPTRILVAEDNAVNQKLISCFLEQDGYDVTVAPNGSVAFELWRANSIELALMDGQMPVMNGFEATERIRNLERRTGRSHMPIIALTAHAMTGDRERCMEAGMDGYLTNPIRREDFRQTRHALLNSRSLQVEPPDLREMEPVQAEMASEGFALSMKT